MKQKAIIALVVMMIITPVAAAQADIIQFSPQDGDSTASFIGEDGADYFAQPFEAQSDDVVEIGTWLLEGDPEGEVTIGIAPADGSGEADVDNMIVESDLLDPTTTGQWFNVTVDATLTTGETYYLVVDGYQNQGATGDAEVGASDQYAGVEEDIRFSDDGGSTWSDLGLPMTLYVGYSTGTPTATASPSPTPTGTPFSPPDDGGQGFFTLIEGFLAFVGLVIGVLAAIAAFGSRSMAVGAVIAYVTFAYLAIETQHTFMTQILTVSLVLVIIGMAFKLWRLEMGGDV